jgi:hypothetical protein
MSPCHHRPATAWSAPGRDQYEATRDHVIAVHRARVVENAPRPPAAQWPTDIRGRTRRHQGAWPGSTSRRRDDISRSAPLERLDATPCAGRRARAARPDDQDQGYDDHRLRKAPTPRAAHANRVNHSRSGARGSCHPSLEPIRSAWCTPIGVFCAGALFRHWPSVSPSE